MSWIKHGALDIFCGPKNGASPKPKAVFLFHGYGANALDLASLSSLLDPSDSWDWFFPQAPLEIPISPFEKGYAWFSLANRDWENFQAGVIDDSGFNHEEKRVLSLAQDFIEDKGKVYSQVVIGGFSQGAILTSHLFYRVPVKVSGLLLFSGYLFHPTSFPSLPDPMKVPFFQTHGKKDPVLPFEGAEKLFSQLGDLGLKGDFVPFSGGHEIPRKTVLLAEKFLSRLRK